MPAPEPRETAFLHANQYGYICGMDHNLTSSPGDDAPAFTAGLVSTELDRTFDRPRAHAGRIRHDGWTPERQAVFLDALAACGVVADAARRAGLSAQSAYAFRNRKAGRAFATAWDAVLIHRARGRRSDELLSRARAGCAESVHRDGVVVAERHRYDNRLARAVLTRLDRLAERTEGEAETLRAVSEDLEDYLDCLEAGGDLDAFIAARRPRCEDPPDEWDTMASIAGFGHLRSTPPSEIDISDLAEPDLTGCSLDQYMRAHYSGFLDYVELSRNAAGALPRGDPSLRPAGFMRLLRERRAALLAGAASCIPKTSAQSSTSSTSPPPAPD